MDKQQTQIRLPAEMFKKIKQQAQENSRSMNGQLIEIIKKGMGIGAAEQAAFIGGNEQPRSNP